jgi:peptidoglycan-N-acetylglucosamine deacetylase
MISVVIPALNEEKVIRECLESLMHQDFADKYEVVVVDNGSRDNTAKIARDMGAMVIPCPHKGVSFARQAGADAAHGEIIVQADADTSYPTWWLSRIKKQFDSHPDAVSVAGTFIYQKRPWWGIFEYIIRAFWNIMAVIFLRRPYIISGANFAFYKRAFNHIGGYHPEAYSSDQFDISTRLSQEGKIVYDRRSWGATSARSVAKPTIVIIYDFVRHLGRFAGHITVPFQALFKKGARKAASVSPGTYIKISVPVLIVGVLCYGYFVPASPVFGKVYYKATTQQKEIALTFDDGPNEPYTSQILDVLNAEDVKATFFLVGANVKQYPDTAKRILAEGSVIGNHSYSHNANHALSFYSYKDIDLAEQTIFNATGVDPHLYRPPHGKKSPWELESIKSEGYIEVLWSISTNELSGRSTEFLSDQIVKKARPGGIILLHDGYGTIHNTAQADKHKTVEMLPLIIQRLKAEGYTFVTIPELLGVPAYNNVGG